MFAVVLTGSSQVHLDRNVMEEAVLEEAEFYNVAGFAMFWEPSWFNQLLKKVLQGANTAP